MSYKIVVDSCCELPDELKKDPRFEIVPLGIEVGDWRIQMMRPLIRQNF